MGPMVQRPVPALLLKCYENTENICLSTLVSFLNFSVVVKNNMQTEKCITHRFTLNWYTTNTPDSTTKAGKWRICLLASCCSLPLLITTSFFTLQVSSVLTLLIVACVLPEIFLLSKDTFLMTLDQLYLLLYFIEMEAYINHYFVFGRYREIQLTAFSKLW